MSNVLIIGASRGIGLELARQYAQAGWRVHATTREPDNPGQLGALPGDLRLHQLEVRSRNHLDVLAKDLAEITLDVVIHNAGVHDRDHAEADVMEINARAPFVVLEPLIGCLARAANPRLVLVSSHGGRRVLHNIDR